MATAEKRTLQIEARLKDFLSRDLTKLERNLTRFGVHGVDALRKLVAGAFSLKGAILGLTAGYVGLQGINLVRKWGEEADALIKLARSTGDTVENISELQAAMKLAGVEDFNGSLRALLSQMRKATDGNDAARESFAALGITLEDLASLSPSQLFERIAQGLEGFNTEQERALALSRVLPKQFLQLLPILGGGLQAFQAAILEARNTGATITQNQAEISERLNDAFSKVGLSLAGVGRELIVAFGPKAIAMLEKLAESITANRDGIVEIAKAIGTGVVTAVSIAIDALIGLVSFIEKLPGVKFVDSEDIDRQIAELEEARNRVFRRGRFDAKDEDAFLAAVAPIDAVIEKLRSERGLAGAMRQARANLQAELAKIAAEVRGAPQPTTDEAAAAVGLPPASAWEAYAKNFGEAMGAMRASRDKAFAGAAPNSPLRPAPANAARLPTPDDEPIVGRDKERLAVLQQIGGLASDLIPVQDALRDLERQSTILALADAKEKGTINAKELADAVAFVNAQFERSNQLVRGGNFFEGFARGAKTATQAWTDFQAAGVEAGASIIDTGLGGLSDAFADIITGTKSAKEAFRDYAKAMLAELARIIAKLVVMAALKTILGLEDGGVVPQADGGVIPKRKGGIIPMASGGALNRNGGIATRPTVLFGEGRNAEAFVPLPDNRSIPVSFVGGGGGGGTTLNFHITAMDSKDVQRVLLEQQGTLRQIWTNQAENRQGVRQTIRRAAS